MTFLVKNKIVAVPAVTLQSEKGSIKVGSAVFLIIGTADDADMVILNDREITDPLIKITGFSIQVEHEKSAAAKGCKGRMKDRAQFFGRHNVVQAVKDRNYGMIFVW